MNMAQGLTARMSRMAISSRLFSSALKPSTSSIITPKPAQFGTRGVHSNMMAATAASPTVGLTLARCLSSMATRAPLKRNDDNNNVDYGATSSLGPILSQEQAEKFAAFLHANKHQKVKPFIIKRRVGQLRTYSGNERNIRHSPWRMNLVCQFAAGLTVPEALKQLMFCQKVKAPLVAKVIRRTANLADIRHGLQPSQLEVAECFATHGTHLKRLKIMGRGR